MQNYFEITKINRLEIKVIFIFRRYLINYDKFRTIKNLKKKLLFTNFKLRNIKTNYFFLNFNNKFRKTQIVVKIIFNFNRTKLFVVAKFTREFNLLKRQIFINIVKRDENNKYYNCNFLEYQVRDCLDKSINK